MRGNHVTFDCGLRREVRCESVEHEQDFGLKSVEHVHQEFWHAQRSPESWRPGQEDRMRKHQGSEAKASIGGINQRDQQECKEREEQELFIEFHIRVIRVLGFDLLSRCGSGNFLSRDKTDRREHIFLAAQDASLPGKPAEFFGVIFQVRHLVSQRLKLFLF